MKTKFLLLPLAALVSATSQASVTLWDTGFPHPVNFNGTDTYLGFSSGNLAGAPQRWAAMPFRVGAGGVRIDQVDVDWFVVAGSEAVNVNYKIWQRSGLNAPGALVTEGVLGAFGAGIDDPRVAGTEDWLHQYTGLNITLPAGDYYFTMYGDIPVNTAANCAWLTGGELQAADLQWDGMWRSVSYPSPGFVVYNPTNVLPGAGMTDPLDRWNCCFALKGLPLVETVPVGAVTLVEGESPDGGLAELAASDDTYYTAFNDSSSLACKIQFDGTTVITTPSQVKFDIEYNVARGGLAYNVALYRYSTGTFVSQNGGVGSTSDQSVSVTISTNAANYVGGAGELSAQIRFNPINDEAPAFDGWQHAVDFAQWTINL
ncbi:MAG: hypothetical protein U0S12_11975 [Fimbriimonadales bacterium]